MLLFSVISQCKGEGKFSRVGIRPGKLRRYLPFRLHIFCIADLQFFRASGQLTGMDPFRDFLGYGCLARLPCKGSCQDD